MADNITLNVGTGGATLATDDAGVAGHVQFTKLSMSADGSATPIPADASGLDVDVTGIAAGNNVIGQVKISDGTDVALVTAGGLLQVDASGAAVPVTDNGGSLTVDGSVTAVSATAANLKAEVVGTGTFAVQADTELTLADMDTGVGTDNRAVVGLVRAESGGGTLVGSANPLPTSPTNATAANLKVEATVAAAQSIAATNAGTFAVQESGGALTALQLIDNIVSGTGANISQIGGAAAPIGAGLEATALRVTVASDSTGVLSVDDNGGALTVDGTVTAVSGTAANLKAEVTLAAAQTLATVTAVTGITNALPAGTNAIGKLAANSGVDIGDVDVLSIAAGTNAIGNVGLIPRTTGGLSMFKSIDLDETEEEVKGSAGQLYGFYAFNNSAAGTAMFFKFYDQTAAGVTVGTTAPTMTFELDGKQGMVIHFPQGLACGTGITWAATTGVADADSGAPGANVCLLNCWYA